MQLHRDYEEEITLASVQLPSCQYHCPTDLYVGRIPAPQQVLMLVDTAQVEARSRAKAYPCPATRRHHGTKSISRVYATEKVERVGGENTEKSLRAARVPAG